MQFFATVTPEMVLAPEAIIERNAREQRSEARGAELTG
jgi:hypothetical protein